MKAGDAVLATATPAIAATTAKYDAAYSAMLDAPENPEAIVTFATIAANIGEYKVAVGTLKRLLLFSSNLATVHANLGFLYLRLGSPEIAHPHL